MLIIDGSISKTNVTKLGRFVCQWWQEYIWLQPIITLRLRNIIPQKSCLLFLLLTVFFRHHLQCCNTGRHQVHAMNSIRWRWSCAYCLADNNTRQHKKPRAVQARWHQSPNFICRFWGGKASWQEFLQRGTETTSAAVFSCLPLWCCYVQRYGGFCRKCGNFGGSKCNFLTNLGNVQMQVQITPFTVWGF